jgi:hypothetical protein
MIKTLEEFKTSIAAAEMPPDLPLHVKALWLDGSGDWKAAHDLIDKLNDKKSAHLHAYLHRKEGDLWNADYWYSKAGQKRPQESLDEEWNALVALFLHL